MENKAAKVLECYALCNSLKNVVRTGWKDWHVNRERVESIAEHVYGVQMLAILMHSTYGYDLDLKKVIMMLAVHEMEEILMGDLTMFQIDRDIKEIIGHKAVEAVLKNFVNKDEIRELIYEFDERKTPEAKFAYYCDKLECDIQAKLYDEAGCVDLNDQEGNKTMEDPSVKALLTTGMTWSEMWLQFGRDRYPYDQNFFEVSEYASNHSISVEPKEYAKDNGIIDLLEYAKTHSKEEFYKHVGEEMPIKKAI